MTILVNDPVKINQQLSWFYIRDCKYKFALEASKVKLPAKAGTLKPLNTTNCN